ncbi:MAG: alpha/beta hydrolase [Planctomycetales bacterium]
MESSESPVTVAALHGNGGGAFRFDRARPFFPESIRFRALTLPGFASEPRQANLQSLSDYAEYLQEILSEEPRPLVLLGHGIGGSLALEFAQRHAADIQGMILHAPVGTQLKSRWFPRLMAVPGARALGKRVFSSPWFRPLFRRLLFSPDVPREYLDRFFDEYRQCTAFSLMFDAITPEWFDGLRPINLPASLLWGKQEGVLTIDQLDAYKPLLPGCPQAPGCVVEIVEDWGHFPMIEHPEDYARRVSALSHRLVNASDAG